MVVGLAVVVGLVALHEVAVEPVAVGLVVLELVAVHEVVAVEMAISELAALALEIKFLQLLVMVAAEGVEAMVVADAGLSLQVARLASQGFAGHLFWVVASAPMGLAWIGETWATLCDWHWPTMVAS